MSCPILGTIPSSLPEKSLLIECLHVSGFYDHWLRLWVGPSAVRFKPVYIIYIFIWDYVSKNYNF